MTGIVRSPRNIAHRIIEEFMLAANEAVAAHLEQTGSPSIYRVHEQPDPKRVMEFEEMAAQFGYSLGVGAIPVSKVCLHGAQTAKGARFTRMSSSPKRSNFPRGIIKSWWRKSRASRRSAF